MCAFKTCLFLLFITEAAFCKELLKACHSQDIPCLTEVTQDFLAQTAIANPTYGLKGIDPVLIEFMEYPINVDLTLTIEDINVTGLKKLKITQFKLDRESKSVVLQVECEVSSRGKVGALTKDVVRNGNFSGKGDAVLTARYNYTLVKNDNGQEHFNIGPEDVECLFTGDLSKVFEVDKEVEDAIKKVDVDLEDLKRKVSSAVIRKAYINVLHNLRVAASLFPKQAFFTDL